MDLVKLRSLVTLAEVGSLTRVAETLHLSPPAVHKQLKQLEAELGVSLYERVGRSLRLLPAAEALLPHARALLAQHEATLEAVREWKGLARGRLRLGTGPTFGTYLLPGLLSAFRRRHPGVDLFVDMGTARDTAASLGRGDLDLSFVAAPSLLDTDGLAPAVTWRFQLPLVAPQGRPAGRPVRLADLTDEPFILYKEGSLLDRLLQAYLARLGVRPREAMRFNSAEMVRAMVGAGLGFGFLPAWMVRAPHADVDVWPQSDPAFEARLALVTRRQSHHSAPVAAFVDLACTWAAPDLLPPAP